MWENISVHQTLILCILLQVWQQEAAEMMEKMKGVVELKALESLVSQASKLPVSLPDAKVILCQKPPTSRILEDSFIATLHDAASHSGSPGFSPRRKLGRRLVDARRHYPACITEEAVYLKWKYLACSLTSLGLQILRERVALGRKLVEAIAAALPARRVDPIASTPLGQRSRRAKAEPGAQRSATPPKASGDSLLPPSFKP